MLLVSRALHLSCFEQKGCFSMFVTLAQKNLARALSLVSSIAGSGHLQMPVLKSLLLCTESDRLAVLAANDDIRLRVRVPATVQAPDTLLLAVQPFARLVGDLPAGDVTLLSPSPVDQTAVQLLCQHITAQFKRSAFPLAEFPQVRFLEEGEELFTLDGDLFKELGEQVAFAAATDASRPVLEGIHVACAHGVATFRAADSFRLAMRAIPIPDQQVTTELLIPLSVLRTLTRVLPSSGAVRVGRSLDGHLLLVQTRDLDLSARLLAGAYPDTHALLNLEASTRVCLPTDLLTNAVQVTAAFAREHQHQVRCTIEADALRLEAEAPDLGKNEVRLSEGVMVSGPSLSFLINQTFLAEALSTVPTPQVMLECLSEHRPVTLKPVGSLDARHIIMPLVPEPTPERSEATATHGAR
jgi:DNA polymerase-3 subunit beta